MIHQSATPQQTTYPGSLIQNTPGSVPSCSIQNQTTPEMQQAAFMSPSMQVFHPQKAKDSSYRSCSQILFLRCMAFSQTERSIRVGRRRVHLPLILLLLWEMSTVCFRSIRVICSLPLSYLFNKCSQALARLEVRLELFKYLALFNRCAPRWMRRLLREEAGKDPEREINNSSNNLNLNNNW